METVIAKTFAMFLLFASHQWDMFLPMAPEHNSMESCQESGKNLLQATTDGSILAFFCAPLTMEQLANLKPQPAHDHHHDDEHKGDQAL